MPRPHITPLRHHTFTTIELGPIVTHHLFDLIGRQHSSIHQAIAINLPGRGMLLDLLIHQRLGCRGLIRLVMTITTIADQINHHVTMEGVAKLQRQLGHQDHCIRIIAVDVKDGRLNHLGNIGTVAG